MEKCGEKRSRDDICRIDICGIDLDVVKQVAFVKFTRLHQLGAFRLFHSLTAVKKYKLAFSYWTDHQVSPDSFMGTFAIFPSHVRTSSFNLPFVFPSNQAARSRTVRGGSPYFPSWIRDCGMDISEWSDRIVVGDRDRDDEGWAIVEDLLRASWKTGVDSAG